LATNFDDPSYIANLEQKAKSNPRDWQSRFELAEIFIDQGNFANALIYLQQADAVLFNSESGSETARLNFIWGLYYDHQDDIPQAIEKYNASVKADPAYARAWRNLGYIYEVFSNGEKMLECFNHALAHSHDSVGIYYDIGVAYDYLEDLEQAISSYRKVLSFTDTIPEAFLNLGVDLGLTGYPDSALYYFGKAKAAGLAGPELYYNLGVMTFEAGSVEMALENFLQVLAFDPSYAPAKLMLGDVYEAIGDSGMARVYYEEFINSASFLYRDDIEAVKEKLKSYNK
jgi:tetratricopeptide (TPR) repeat protein